MGLSRDYAALFEELFRHFEGVLHASLLKDYAGYNLLSAHNAVNSTTITSKLFKWTIDSLSRMETKYLVEEIMTNEDTSTEAMPGHYVTIIIWLQ